MSTIYIHNVVMIVYIVVYSKITRLLMMFKLVLSEATNADKHVRLMEDVFKVNRMLDLRSDNCAFREQLFVVGFFDLTKNAK